ncbi:hypothetical protein ACHAW6_014108 [Cyclotella cf. meneghiniana]
MSCKSQAHEALGLLFAREGVPPKMIVDNGKEMKLGGFSRKCKEALCYLHDTEPYSLWSNSAEQEIRELKKGAARKLTHSGAPRQLWCYALEYESYVRSHTAHDIYKLDGHVPNTVVLGKTVDTSPFCEFGFWDWVKFQDKGITFPDDPLVLGKYLGPSIDVGPAVTQCVMKANVKVEDCSTVCQLTPEERLARVLCRKRDSHGMPVGRPHKQPAMDTHVYKVHFPDGCTKELAAKVIVESLYAQCDPDGNQYIMLDAIVDYHKNLNVAVTHNNQVNIVDGKKVISHSTRGWELCCEWKDSSTSWQKCQT